MSNNDADDMEEDEQNQFLINPQDIKATIEKAVKSQLGKEEYNIKKVSQWTANIIAAILRELNEGNKQFKYIVTSIVQQKTGAGLHSSFLAYWDNDTDGFVTHPFHENQSLYCITTVYYIQI